LTRSKEIFADGDVIFREGETSDRAYEIFSGKVEILKDEGGKPVHQGYLGPGEMFGEMAVLDGGVHGATARAVGRTVVRSMDRGGLIDSMQQTPESTLGMMGRLIKRLRGGKPAPAPAADGASYSNPSLLRRLIDGLGTDQERIGVRVAKLTGENADQNTRHLIAALGNSPAIQTRGLSKALKLDVNADRTKQIERISMTARRWLIDTEADVLIWGHVPAPGSALHLHFVTLANWDQQAPGAFDFETVLAVPAGFGAEVADLLRTVTLAAALPGTRAKQALKKRALADGLEPAALALDQVLPEMTSRERATLQSGYASVLAAAARPGYDAELLARAAERYRIAASVLSEKESPEDWARVHKHLGSILHIEGERNRDPAMLDKAESLLIDAADILDRAGHPRAWGALQNRLGLISYRRGFESGDTAELKRALRRFKSALAIYTRDQTPMRWAEIMSNVAQAAQVLGEHVKSLEALATAANACKAVLEVRSRSQTPMLWAASQNNLGSALFLLGKQTRNVERLEASVAAFEQALEVYEARNNHRLAAITAKNLDRARDMVDDFRPRNVAELDWEQDGDERDRTRREDGDNLPFPGEALNKDSLPFPGEDLEKNELPWPGEAVRQAG